MAEQGVEKYERVLAQCFSLKPFSAKGAKSKPEEKVLNLICKIVKNKHHHLNVLLNSFHLNGHTLGFHPQTQKFKPLLTQGSTLELESYGLIVRKCMISEVEAVIQWKKGL